MMLARAARAVLVPAALALALATPAAAQTPVDFFAALFGGIVRPQQTAPRLLEAPPSEAPVSRPSRSTAYCVRMCDGRYFPLTSTDDADEKCAAFCPSAEAKVFRGGATIDSAASSDGKSYTEIPNAFLYRTKLVDSCSCTGTGPLGLAKLKIEEDDTLRNGDVVMTADGARVFQSKSGATPHAASAFVPPEDAAKLSRDMKKRIEDLKLAGAER